MAVSFQGGSSIVRGFLLMNLHKLQRSHYYWEGKHFKPYPETNTGPESRPSRKEFSSSNHPLFGAMLVSGVYYPFYLGMIL